MNKSRGIAHVWPGLLAALLLAAPAAQAAGPAGFQEAYEAGQDDFNLGKYDEAKLQFEKAKKLAPDKPGPYRWLGRLGRTTQDFPACVDNAIAALRLAPESKQSGE